MFALETEFLAGAANPAEVMAEVVVAQPSFFSELPALVTRDRLPD